MERVELVAPAVAAEVAGVLGALLDIVATQPRVVLRPAVPRQRAAPTRLPSWHRWHWRHSDVQAQVHRHPEQPGQQQRVLAQAGRLRGLVRSTRTSWISRLNSPPGPNRVSMPDEPVRPDGRPWQRGSEGSTADSYDKVCRRNRHTLILTVSGDPNKLLPELSGRSGPQGGPRAVLPFRDPSRT